MHDLVVCMLISALDALSKADGLLRSEGSTNARAVASNAGLSSARGTS